MKLDRPSAPHLQPLAPEEWTMSIASEGNQHVAIVERAGRPLVRLSLDDEGLNNDEIRTALAEKARAWIAEYIKRRYTGATGLSRSTD